MITNINIDITKEMNIFKEEIKGHALKEEMIVRIVRAFILSHMENANYKSPLLCYYNPSSTVYKQSKESLIRLFSNVLGTAKTICDMYIDGYRAVTVETTGNRYNLNLTLQHDKEEIHRYTDVTTTIRVDEAYGKYIRELANEGYVFNNDFLITCLNHELAKIHNKEPPYVNNPLNAVIDDEEMVKNILDMFYRWFKEIIMIYQDRYYFSEKWIDKLYNNPSKNPKVTCLQFINDTRKGRPGSILGICEVIQLKINSTTNI